MSAEAATRCDVTCGRDRVPAGHAPSPPAHPSRRDLPSFGVWRELSIFRQNKSRRERAQRPLRESKRDLVRGSRASTDKGETKPTTSDFYKE